MLSEIKDQVDRQNRELSGLSNQLQQIREQLSKHYQADDKPDDQSGPQIDAPHVPEKPRALKPLPALNDPAQFRTWEDALRESLDKHGLCDHIDEDDMPSFDDEAARQRWKDDSRDVYLLIMASIQGQTKLIERMKTHG